MHSGAALRGVSSHDDSHMTISLTQKQLWHTLACTRVQAYRSGLFPCRKKATEHWQPKPFGPGRRLKV